MRSRQEALVHDPAEEVFELTGHRLTPEEEQLNRWFAEQRLASVTNLEQAARQIITLCTTLLSVLLGLLALAKETLPSYLNSTGTRLVATAGILLFLVALVSALDVVKPRRWSVDRRSPEEQRQRFIELLDTKNLRLHVAVYLFGGAMLCLVGIILSALWLA